MGLGKQSNYKPKIYLKIFEGKISKTVQEGTENSVHRINKNGNKVYELYYPYVEGKMVDLNVEQSQKYGASIKIDLEDSSQEVFTLTIPVDSMYGQKFICKLKNLDLSKYIRVTPYSFEDKDTGKNRKGVTIYQPESGEYFSEFTDIKPVKINDFITYEMMPEIKKTEMLGQTKYDNTDRILYLVEHLQEFIKGMKSDDSEQELETTEGTKSEDNNETSDLPF